MSAELHRRAFAELVGTAFLLVAVVGSGIAAERLSPGDAGLQLLENAMATAAALVAIILAVGRVSGAHRKPVITLAARLAGRLGSRDAAAYVGAQVVGAALGAVVANLMFDLAAVDFASTKRSSAGLWLGEVVATLGLVLVVLGMVHGRRAGAAAFAVGGYIGAAYFLTSLTSVANPAATLARTLSDTFSGIRPSSAPTFVAAQVVGTALAVASAPRALPGHGARPGEAVVTPAVLFVCVHNAGRSQMAAAFLSTTAGTGSG